MGLRGPGAKPVSRAPTANRGKGRKRPAWQRAGLSRAEKVIVFCEGLTITAGKDAGKPLVLREWQRDIIRALYATDAEGKRNVRQAVVSMGRKNGKSALAAALALCHLVGPEAVPRGQVVSAAADRGQAALIYAELRAFALARKDIADRLVFRDFNKTVEDIETGATFAALSSDHRKAHGLSPVMAIADELAQWRGRDLLDALRTGQGAHAEPLLLCISTRSPDPDNPLEELIRYGEEVEDPQFRTFMWSAPLDADPWAETTLAAANPGLGDFRDIADVRMQAKQAMRIPSLEMAFRAYVLNQPVVQEDRFIGPVDWEACADSAEERGPVYGGLDLASGAADLTAFALFWPETGALKVTAFLPSAVIDQKSHEDRADYRVWQKRGHVVEIPGRAIDRAWLGAWIARETASLDLQGIASDRWGLEDLKASWEREGIDLPLQPIGTGYRDMSPALTAFEALVLDRRLHHHGNPLLRWATSNAVVDMDPSGNRKLAKDRANGRIDPLVAAVVAVGLHAKEPPAPSYDLMGIVLNA